MLGAHSQPGGGHAQAKGESAGTYHPPLLCLPLCVELRALHRRDAVCAASPVVHMDVALTSLSICVPRADSHHIFRSVAAGSAQTTPLCTLSPVAVQICFKWLRVTNLCPLPSQPQMVLDKSATDDQLLGALRDEMGRLKAQLQQAHHVQAQLQAAAASGTPVCCDNLVCSGLFFCFLLAVSSIYYMRPRPNHVADFHALLIRTEFFNVLSILFIVLFYTCYLFPLLLTDVM
jgi:hypothetical protein